MPSKDIASLLMKIVATKQLDKGVDKLFPQFLCRQSGAKLDWLSRLIDDVLLESSLDPVWKFQLTDQLSQSPSMRLFYAGLNSTHLELFVTLCELPRKLQPLANSVVEDKLKRLQIEKPQRSDRPQAVWPVRLLDWRLRSEKDRRLEFTLRINSGSSLARKTLVALLRQAQRDGHTAWAEELSNYQSWQRDSTLCPLYDDLCKATGVA